jgi:hypothetical protein
MLAADNASDIQTANAFISHGWGCVFLDVIDALRVKFENQPDVVLWFDMFSNNQHDLEDKSFSWFQNIFMSAIKKIGKVYIGELVVYCNT